MASLAARASVTNQQLNHSGLLHGAVSNCTICFCSLLSWCSHGQALVELITMIEPGLLLLWPSAAGPVI